MKKDNCRAYPKDLRLNNGHSIRLRQMHGTDREAILAFTRALPPDDLLFLRTDITEPAMVDEWIRSIGDGSTVTVVAETAGALAGYASLHLEQARWTRRVGEIRVQVALEFRGSGLGRQLAGEIIKFARGRRLGKLAAMMTPDQTGARAAFERLGFEVEALLREWVLDRNGKPRDLLIMSHDLEAHRN